MIKPVRKVKNGYCLYENDHGPVIGTALDRVVIQDGLVFRAADDTDELYPYMDWRLSPEERVNDLTDRLSDEELMGLMVYGIGNNLNQTEVDVKEKGVRSIILTGGYLDSASVLHRNKLQRLAESGKYSIPIKISCPGPEQVGQMPMAIGLAACLNPSELKKQAVHASELLRAAGIMSVFTPRAAIGTEPWGNVFSQTFGMSTQFVLDSIKAVSEGLQGTDGKPVWSESSVSSMTGVWPGLASFARKNNVDKKYSGHNTRLHLKPFKEGAWNLFGGSQSCAGVLARRDVKELRFKNKFKGIIIVDWLNWSANRNDKIQAMIDACVDGGDQFIGLPGDEFPTQVLSRAREEFGEGRVRERLKESGVRILINMFRCGIFENPFGDARKVHRLSGGLIYQNLMKKARYASIVLLKNREATLPLVRTKLGVYSVSDWERTTRVAVIDGHDAGKTLTTATVDKVRKAKKAGQKVVLVLNCSRPVLLEAAEPYCDAVLINLGARAEEVRHVLAGDVVPTGLLPFRFPATSYEIGQHYSDVPFDMKAYVDSEGHVYDFAYGCDFEGQIQDYRTTKYNTETWDAIDRDGKKLGFCVPRVAAKSLDEGVYHLVVQVYTVTKDGKVLVTKRAPIKSHPLCWEVTGGSVLCGETSEEGAVRELVEETGLVAKASSLERLYTLVDDGRHCIYHGYLNVIESSQAGIRLQKGETVEAQFLDKEDFIKLVESPEFVPSEQGRFRANKEKILSKLLKTY